MHSLDTSDSFQSSFAAILVHLAQLFSSVSQHCKSFITDGHLLDVFKMALVAIEVSYANHPDYKKEQKYL
jgi:hypothetical protein